MKPKHQSILLLIATFLITAGLGWLVLKMNQPQRLRLEPLPVLFNVPAFEFKDQDNQSVSDKTLQGQVWICDFIFTRCTTACPVLSSRMLLLQRSLKGKNVKFISFSVDPEYDTPAQLKNYAATWNADESRWRLVNTVSETVMQDLIKGMKLIVEKSTDPDNPIIHTSSFLLIDGKGQVRGLYNSNDEDKMAELVADTAQLIESPVNEQPVVDSHDADPIKRGRELYATLGCMACHTQPKIAPILSGLAGAEVRLNNNRTVKATDDYIRESIVEPAAKVSNGYVSSMPSYEKHLTTDQVDALVAYIKSMKEVSAQTAPRELQIDPVCHMEVSAASDTPHAEHAGKTYYFCSAHCEKRFVADPLKFTQAKEK